MTEYKKIFLDTAPFIYLLEKNPEYFESMKEFFNKCIQNKIELITSAITVEEYCVYPLKNEQPNLVLNFNSFIYAMNIKIINIDKNIALEAAKIRSEYKAFKAMDSLQLATAKIESCDLFLTNDKQLRQFSNLNCKTVDEL